MTIQALAKLALGYDAHPESSAQPAKMGTEAFRADLIPDQEDHLDISIQVPRFTQRDVVAVAGDLRRASRWLRSLFL